MNRRDVLQSVGAVAAFAAAVGVRAADAAAAADDDDAAPARPAALVPALQACTVAVAACIAHCQRELAGGNRMLGDCLRTSLDCDIACNALLRAATLESTLVRGLAPVAVQAMKACVEACKPHISHHATCKACHDACVAAIEAVSAIT